MQQQQYHYDQPEKSVPDRIVSFYKPYLRPIVRGKENKRVEFGAKVHQLQVGGCNFIEHLSFGAFHEGNRLKKTVWLHRHGLALSDNLRLTDICHQQKPTLVPGKPNRYFIQA